MKKILLFSACALTLAACGGSETDSSGPNVLMHSDFEGIDGWIPSEQSSTLTREKAHSGKTSIKVDATHEYSLTFSKPLGQLHDSRPKQITVTAWAFLPDAQAAASLVVSINDPAAPDKPLLWQAIDLSKGNKPFGKWKEIDRTITVPANVGSANKLSIYLWRSSGSHPVYVDDITASVAE